jgi:hypothetical protein
MSNYVSIVTFILTTYVYYLFLPKLTYDTITKENEIAIYYSNSYTFLAIYFFAVIIIQCIVNMNVITEKCGGSVSDNIGYAGMITIVPWTLLFGILILILTMYPGFKSAFSDVIGYYWISSSANQIITELLIDRDVENQLSENMDPTKKDEIDRAADAIIKICGNSSVLINQMTPTNFQNFWEILTPLKKKQYRENSEETIKKRDELFELVVEKDNVGQMMWFLYTGILVTSVVQLKISTRGCANNVKTMEANYQKFKDGEKTAEKNIDDDAETTDYAATGSDYAATGSDYATTGSDYATTGSEYAANKNVEYNK